MIPLDDQFLEALDPLSPRERKVLRLRFGLENGRLKLLISLIVNSRFAPS
jgi:DNA-directed RNA polymerase sigma subunit (sigma70/sigma32)